MVLPVQAVPAGVHWHAGDDSAPVHHDASADQFEFSDANAPATSTRAHR